MIDHILVDVITRTRRALESALLQRQAVEERFQVDVFLGDVSWETSYSLPGEEQPPRVRADISVDWPTWSQSAYRSWSIGEPPEDHPEVVLAVTLRLQRLATSPPLEEVLALLPEETPSFAGDSLTRATAVVEHVLAADDAADRFAVETTYQGTFRLDDGLLENPEAMDDAIGVLARWLASVLVRLGDLPFDYLPPDPAPEPGRG